LLTMQHDLFITIYELYRSDSKLGLHEANVWYKPACLRHKIQHTHDDGEAKSKAVMNTVLAPQHSSQLFADTVKEKLLRQERCWASASCTASLSRLDWRLGGLRATSVTLGGFLAVLAPAQLTFRTNSTPARVQQAVSAEHIRAPPTINPWKQPSKN